METGGSFGYSWFGNSDKSSIAGYGVKIGVGVNKFIGQGVAIETLVNLDIYDNCNKETDVKPLHPINIFYKSTPQSPKNEKAPTAETVSA